MDSVTQAVLGAAVGEAVLGKKIGNKAMLYGAIAGTIPDLDIFAEYFTDTISAIEIHRGFSHSIIFALLVSPLLGYITSRIECKEQVSVRQWTLLFFLGFITHSLLDVFTTWGTQLFWPLDIRLDLRAIFVIDPLYTLPLIIFLIFAMRQKRESSKRRKFNNLGLYISSGYLILTLIFKLVIYQKFTDALRQEEIKYARLETRPSPFNIILWYANIETDKEYLIGEYSFFDTRPIVFKPLPKNHDLVENIQSAKNMQRLIKISEGWYSITKDEAGLYFNDLRFGMLNPEVEPPQFTFSYRLEIKEGEVTAHEVPKTRRDGKQLLKNLWKRIKGN